MRSKLSFLALALVFQCGRASADTITTGNLSFTCSVTGCPGESFGTALIVPTTGSFIFDNTTGQFVNIFVTWDGIPLVLNGSVMVTGALNEATLYQELIGAGSQWVGICGSANIPLLGPCDKFAFVLGTPAENDPAFLGWATFPISPTFESAAGEGAVTATDLEMVSTSEPTATHLILLSLGVILAHKGFSRRYP